MNISVIIPSYNTRPVIDRCIEAIMDQTLPRKEYEVIVIDDGSKDGTLDRLHEQEEHHEFTLIENRKNRGVAYSRNRAIRAARNELVVLIQDDIIVEKHFLETHLRAHQQLGERDNQVVVGYTYWHPELEQTPFLEYLDRGQQFDYERFMTKEDIELTMQQPELVLVPADYLLFYTSNMSFHKSFVQPTGGFDEDFYQPGITAYEDTELAWRLKQQGMEIYFAPQARAAHHHQRTLESIMERRFAEGMMTHKLNTKHPDFSWSGETFSFWHNISRLKLGALFSRYRFPLVFATTLLFNPLVIWPLEKLAKRLQYRSNLPFLYKIVLGNQYNKGWWEGRKS